MCLIITISFILSVNYLFHNTLSDHHRKRINIHLGKDFDPHGAGYNLIQSIEILSNAINTFSNLLISDLDADQEVCKSFIENSLALCTALVPELGYDKSAEVAYRAYKEKKTIRQVLKENKILSNEKIDSILDSKKMI